MVRNPFYTGKFLYNGNLFNGVHKPMLTQAEFDLIQEIYGFASKARPVKHQFTFNNLIRCDCGGWYCAEQHIKTTRMGKTSVLFTIAAHVGNLTVRVSMSEKTI